MKQRMKHGREAIQTSLVKADGIRLNGKGQVHNAVVLMMLT